MVAGWALSLGSYFLTPSAKPPASAKTPLPNFFLLPHGRTGSSVSKTKRGRHEEEAVSATGNNPGLPPAPAFRHCRRRRGPPHPRAPPPRRADSGRARGLLRASSCSPSPSVSRADSGRAGRTTPSAPSPLLLALIPGGRASSTPSAPLSLLSCSRAG